MDLSVGTEDVDGLTMVAAPAATVTGSIISDTGEPFDFRAPQLQTDTRGNPVLDATVVVFPANDKLWTYQSRFIRAARPDQEGRYRVTALPAPEPYLVVALQGLEDGQAGDPEFLAAVKDLAATFELAEGETKAVDVKLSAKQWLKADR